MPSFLDTLLYPLTLPQRIGMQRRLAVAPTRVDARVISFGNITTGGTGKTPAVIERAGQELAAGRRVAVITRGYGSRRTPEALVVMPGDASPQLWQRIGDEPALIRLRVPGVIIVKSADRVAGAKAAIARGCDCLLLDDGFQSVALARDEDIVLVDATRPFSNGRMLPLGSLREAPCALARATEVWLTRCIEEKDTNAAAQLVEHHHGKAPTRRTVHVPTGLWRVKDGESLPLSALHQARVYTASAIANPQGFEDSVRGLGAEIIRSFRHRDHRPFEASSLPEGHMVIVTEKDAVRLHDARDNVYALAIELKDL